MSLDVIHNQLINHYRKTSLNKQLKGIKKESIIKQTYQKKNVDNEKGGKIQDFLRNQAIIAAESRPLGFRQLPRNLKVFFPGPPQAPDKLIQVPYTYQIVPKVPFKMPKQRKGKAAQWVVEQSYFVESKTKHSKQLMKKQRTHNRSSSDVAQRFRAAVKKLATKMKQQNLSLGEIIANKGLIKKPHNFYNSQQFFSLIKKGDIEAIRLLEENEYLAFDIDDLKMTPLHWAARAGHAEIVNILTTKYRANTLAKDNYGRTPLHLAVAKRHIECIIRIFIEGGKITSLNNAKQSVRSVAPDIYTKFLLEKLEEIRFVIRGKGIKDIEKYKKLLQQTIRQSLDQGSLYF